MASISIPRPHHRLHALPYYWQAVIVVIVGSFMVMLDTTVVNIALPRIITVFGADIHSTQYVLTGYMLALAVIMPATGYLTDTFGTKRVYLLSMFFFTAGSALCASAWNVPSLVLFRLLQGLGGGMMMPLAMTILFKVVPMEKRGTVMGVFGLPMLLGPVLGPTLGGYLVEYVDWRFIFTLNIPVGALGLLLGTTLLRETETRRDLHLDLRGFVLSGTGFGALLYALSEAPTDGWGDPFILGLLTLGSVSLLGWLWTELTVAEPLVELRVFRSTTYSLATFINFIVTMGMFSTMFLMPIFLQNFRGLGAMESGILLLPQALASTVTMPISGKLFDRFGPRPVVVTGLLLMGYSTWELSFINLATSNGELTRILIERGLGMGLVMMPVMTVAMNSVPPALIARSSSLTNVLRQVFASFGTAIFATLLSTHQTFHQAMISQTVTPDSLGVKAAMAGVQSTLMEHGLTAIQAKTAVVMALYRQVVTSASVMAFDDCFYIAAVVCVVAVAPTLLLRTKGVAMQRPRGPMAAE
ncbi:MAG: DHA2 family efflux MFS transporter permease subunit [Chloroflexi bacterium]|nr:DHA2 family efflux MFS transporter permease subunit [Chloroflexota bacterium]